MTPSRRITTPEDLQKWIDSPSYQNIVLFVLDLQQLVEGLTNDAPVPASEACMKLLDIMAQVDGIIDANPVVIEKDISRFGKVEFRDFYDELQQNSQNILKPLWSQKTTHQDAERFGEELATYFSESWGNRTRIDYGSGHELNFISFLYCLYKHEVIQKEDMSAVTLKVFTKYIAIMRRLQKTYWLEPAGSHGVWGLDDYHFLPFLFGSAQLSTHPHMKPKLIHNEELVAMYHEKYMYLECIYFINKIKTLPTQDKLSLRWHSPMLDDILSAKSWQKIKDGMIKMYKAEVLSKLPIVQHFMFGDTIPCPEGVGEHEHVEEDCGHVHVNTWGDCCGIKIPSAIAASESLKRNGFKPVPFD
ncbi:Phosphotyrosyl phosphatase activator [Suhomyces tanzawaensis NRRL Y-17324]|uniref:Serine/threonine-protein phosphatase 2A activator n=1 Tax=Suhomyces tanzawaensis NRRL Y-17324 TaxID=984487 RepID=A0A1E4SQ13_9ASCO|nr:Phosphotyrosyl phosphatase activator [Suhomyces tanzawaensis NRRL Y-17324]ODV81502.1 Phosphotyrosyl phosphatase activator [Suhomyces tanzawaensis NRRL Y-17324]